MSSANDIPEITPDHQAWLDQDIAKNTEFIGKLVAMTREQMIETPKIDRSS